MDEDMKTWRHGNRRHGHGDMETWTRTFTLAMETWTWRHGDIETCRYGYKDIETWIHGEMETGRHGNMETRRHRGMEK